MQTLSRLSFGKSLLAFAGLLLPAAGQAATLNVPTAAYPTIQSGITAAAPGDTVLLADGTYTGPGNRDLDFGGKAITVASQHGAAKTIMDLQYQWYSVRFHSGETAAAKLQGLTIENGLGNGTGDGGGIIVAGSSPTISDCVVTGNFGQFKGGGLFADETSIPTIIGCAFTGNLTSGGSGGGLYLEGSGTITDCTFTGNSSKYYGGGIYLAELTDIGAVVSDCIFSGNTAAPTSAGPDGRGGGIYAASSTRAPSYILSCVFAGNTAKTSGGGIYGQASIVTNCTMYGNTAPVGAGVYLTSGANILPNNPDLSSSLTNCILYADNGSEVENGGTIVPVTYCELPGSYSGTGNVSLPPQFVNAPSDLHLQAASPLLHIGTSAGAPATTADGILRPGTPSIGAYEIGPALLPDTSDSYVLSSAPTQNFGSAPTLTVGGFLGSAYVKFDLSSLSPLTAGSTAHLHLNAGRAFAGAASVTVSATGTKWTEASLLFSNRPPPTLPVGFLNLSADGVTTAPYDVDVTPYVKAQAALGVTQISFGLSQSGSGLPVSIDSKENPAGDGPQLIISY